MVTLSGYKVPIYNPLTQIMEGVIKSEQHLEMKVEQIEEQIKEEPLDTKYEVKEEPCHAELWFKEENEDDIWVKEEADDGEVAGSSNVQGELHEYLNCVVSPFLTGSCNPCNKRISHQVR